TQVSGTGASWANPQFAGSLNGVSATSSVSTPNSTNESVELEFRSLGFNLPANATIQSVRVEVTGSASGSCSTCAGGYARLEYTKTARLEDGGTLGPTRNNRSTSVSTNLGTSNDTWGLTLTPAVVNASSFGVRLRVKLIPVTTYFDITHPNGAPVDC